MTQGFATPVETSMRPPLKWAGGKRWLVPRLRQFWEPYANRRLIEPFCGGLAVSLGLRPKRAQLNDNNPHVINFYHWLRRGLSVDIPMANDAELFYRHRERFNTLIHLDQHETKEAAELFYYLNRTAYNGLCRFNSKGEFNVPFGKYGRIRYTADFSSYQTVLAAWQFRHGSFDTLQLEPDDFVYADPPYDVEFTRYSKEDFGWEDQVRLAEWLAQHPGPVVASNQATDRVKALYQEYGFTLQILPAPRRISCNGDRTPADEVLAFKGLDHLPVPESAAC